MSHVTADTRSAAENLARGFADAFESWIRAGMSAGTRFAEPLAGEPVVEAMRRRTSAGMQAGADIAAAAAGEFAAIAAEQARFAARLSDRLFDCSFGPHAARTPEAATATVRCIVNDCMETAVATGERLARLGTSGLERMQDVVARAASPVDAAGH